MRIPTAGNTLGARLRPLVTLAPSPPRLRPAVKAALTVLLCLGVGTALGRQDLGLLCVTGTFAVLYAPGAPLRRRAWTVGLIGLGLVVSTALGGFTVGSTVLFVAVAVVWAMVTAGVCLALRVGPPGSYFLVLCAGIAHFLAGDVGTSPALISGMTAVGAVVALAVTLLELVPDPRRPERLAVEAATRAVAAYAASEPGTTGRPLHRAAAQALAAAEEAVAEGMWGNNPALTRDLETARSDYDRRASRAVDPVIPAEDLSWDPHNPDAGRWVTDDQPRDVDMPSGRAAQRAGRAVAADERAHIRSARRRLTDGLRYPGEPWSVAVSVGVATTLSVLVLVFVVDGDQTHLYWAIAFSALVLHQGGPRVARTYRAVHRLIGTVLGLILFLVVAFLHPSGWPLVLLIVALQFAIELLVTRTYGLAVTLITPLALLVATGGRYGDEPWTLVAERLLDTVIAVLVALLVLWALGRRAHHRAVRGDTRRVLLELARYSSGERQRSTEPTLAPALRDLYTSTALLTADGHGDCPEAATANAVVDAGYLVLSAPDPRAAATAGDDWSGLARQLPAGRRDVGGTDPADMAVREQCERLVASLS